MAKIKTTRNNNSVRAFIDAIEDESKRKDCRAITKLMATATGEAPRMWGTSIVGFGTHHYTYADGKPGEICKVGFSPRARSFSFYLPKYPEHVSLVKKLGKYKYSGGCLHVTRLADVDTEVLALMVKSAYRTGGSGPC
jgi:hypothetical protein